MDYKGLVDAYSAVYNEDLREEILHVEEMYEIIDELSDNELDEIVEEVIHEESLDINECVEYIEEAKVTYGHDTDSPDAERRTHRIERVKSAAKRIGKAAVAKAKEKAPEIKAAAKKMGKAAVAKAKEKAPEIKAAAKKAVKGILSKGKELFNKGRSALAKGLRKGSELASKAAAKVEPKEKKAERAPKPYRGEGVGRRETVGKSVKAAAKEAIKAARDTKYRGAGAGRKEAASSGGISSKGGSMGREGSKGTALPAAGRSGGSTKAGKVMNKSQRAFRNAARGFGEEYEVIAALMLEDIIEKGFAESYEEAYELLEGLTDYEVGEIAENFEFLAEEILSEEVEERDDLFDSILEYLVSEGYADTNENALVIMANMSEDWKNQIISTIKG